MNQQPSIFLHFEGWQPNSNVAIMVVLLRTLSLAKLPLNTHVPFMAIMVTKHGTISPSNQYAIWLYFDNPYYLTEQELSP